MRLPTKTRKRIACLLKKKTSSKVHRRYLALKMSDEGESIHYIAGTLGVDRKTITRWFAQFEAEGLEGLAVMKYDGRRVSQLEGHKEDITKKITQDNMQTLNALQAYLKETYRITTSTSGLHWFLKKNGVLLQKDTARTRQTA